MKFVRHTKRQGMFNEGDVSEFEDATADQIVDHGYGELVCGLNCALDPGHAGGHETLEMIVARETKPVAKSDANRATTVELEGVED